MLYLVCFKYLVWLPDAVITDLKGMAYEGRACNMCDNINTAVIHPLHILAFIVTLYFPYMTINRSALDIAISPFFPACYYCQHSK